MKRLARHGAAEKTLQNRENCIMEIKAIKFRNGSNRKWFALVAEVERDKLGLKGEDKVSLINLKCDPVFIGSLLNGKGYLPAYHMNKKTWITVLLDGSVPEEEVRDLIHLSYELVSDGK